MKEQFVKYNITVQGIELKDFTRYSEFTNETQPSVARGTENAINCARGRRVKELLSSFQTAIKSANTSISSSFVYTEPTTFPTTAPTSLSFILNVYHLESFLELWDSSVMSVGTSTASETSYTADEITKVAGVIRYLISENLKIASVELLTIPVQINSIDYPLDSPNNMTSSTKTVLTIQSTTIPGISTPVVTVSASD